MPIEKRKSSYVGVCDGCDNLKYLKVSHPNSATHALKTLGWRRVRFSYTYRAFLWRCDRCIKGLGK